jgi:hypothetical protein
MSSSIRSGFFVIRLALAVALTVIWDGLVAYGLTALIRAL